MATFPILIDRAQLARDHAAQIVQILRDTDQTMPAERSYTAKLPGDEHALRGIPAIGRGVTGAITGTRPGSRL